MMLRQDPLAQGTKRVTGSRMAVHICCRKTTKGLEVAPFLESDSRIQSLNPVPPEPGSRTIKPRRGKNCYWETRQILEPLENRVICVVESNCREPSSWQVSLVKSQYFVQGQYGARAPDQFYLLPETRQTDVHGIRGAFRSGDTVVAQDHPAGGEVPP